MPDDIDVDWKAAAEGDPQAWEAINARMADFSRRMEDRAVEHRAQILASKTNFIHDKAWLCWKHHGLQLHLCENPHWQNIEGLRAKAPDLYAMMAELGVGRFNGYVTFPKLPMIAPGYRGILTYVPVHGGITFCQDWHDGTVTYGFDTAHAWSGEMGETINDVGWMMAETESLARGIYIASRFEPYYLRAEDNEAKVRVLDRMNQFLPLDVRGNFGSMINLMTGEL